MMTESGYDEKIQRLEAETGSRATLLPMLIGSLVLIVIGMMIVVIAT